MGLSAGASEARSSRLPLATSNTWTDGSIDLAAAVVGVVAPVTPVVVAPSEGAGVATEAPAAPGDCAPTPFAEAAVTAGAEEIWAEVGADPVVTDPPPHPVAASSAKGPTTAARTRVIRGTRTAQEAISTCRAAGAGPQLFSDPSH